MNATGILIGVAGLALYVGVLVVVLRWFKNARVAGERFDQTMADHQRDKRVVHCWEDGPDGPDYHSTCMLLDGHEGPHEFTPDSDIVVAFADTEDDQ